MKIFFSECRRRLINGTDRQLFYRSLIILMVLVGLVQIGINTGHWLSYLGAFIVSVVYAYLWLELLKRFGNKDRH